MFKWVFPQAQQYFPPQVALALIGCAVAEPPVGYSYSGPSSLSISGGLSSGGHYSQVPIGHQTSEGYQVDPHLLEKVRHIILKDEIQNQAYQQSSGYSSQGHGHGVSSHYGAPAPVYGVPNQRIVGIELEHLQQAIQVAQYHQADEGYASGYAGGYSSGGYSGGYSSGQGSDGHGSISYSAPAVSYATIGVPSGSYGIPSVSSSYGAPHH